MKPFSTTAAEMLLSGKVKEEKKSVEEGWDSSSDYLWDFIK